MKKLFVCFLLAWSGNYFAQDYIVSINLKIMDGKQILESLNLPIILEENGILLTKIRQEYLSDFEENDVPFKVIYKLNDNSNYFLLRDISGKNRTPDNGVGYVIYKSENCIISEEIFNETGYFYQRGFSVNDISKIKVTYRLNEQEKSFLPGPTDNPILNSLLEDINADSVRYYIQSLQDFGTRYVFSSNRGQVAGWIKKEFERFGFVDVELDSFYYNGTWQTNVVATLPGTAFPEKVIVIGGHHDSITFLNPLVSAPGADDNASGTAAVLEIARVMKLNGIQPEATIKFVTFAAEERGLIGGYHFAESAKEENMNIMLMINHDMISNTSNPVESSVIDINHYSGCSDFRDLAINLTNEHTIITPLVGSLNSSGSDSYAFFENGFPAVYFEERDFSPFYHSDNDLIENCNIEFCSEVIKASCALAFTVSESPAKIAGLKLEDVGNGSSVKLSWLPGAETDINVYSIRYGTSANNLDNLAETSENTIQINSLTEGVKYYFSVEAKDNEGNESVPQSISGSAHLFPAAPVFTVNPKWHYIDINWADNTELDFAGYNIYRNEAGKAETIKLNEGLLTVTFYSDTQTKNGVYYDYTVKAVDLEGNESLDNLIIKSRHVSLDRGILVVDETLDGDGTVQNPSDEQTDEFFNSILNGFPYESFDIQSEKNIGLADIGAYSIVVWHGNDSKNLDVLFPVQNDLRSYLNFGGKFLYAGYKPSKVFDNVTNSIADLDEGSFLFDYAKITRIENKLATYFSGAESACEGYPELLIDAEKVPDNNNQLKFIESISPNTLGKTIYLYDSKSDPGTPQGSMKGMPVGVEYIGEDYSIITLSFPLYYINTDQAKSFMNFVMTDKFDQTTFIADEDKLVPNSFELKQNYPNPFNPATTVSYQLPSAAKITLKVFDILGREVKTLVDEIQPAGYYHVKFDGSNLASGVYFYRMSTHGYDATKKLILIK